MQFVFKDFDSKSWRNCRKNYKSLSRNGNFYGCGVFRGRQNAMHVQLADESYCLGGPQVADSYLNMAAIITVAVATGAQAIHPGYGLLSENAKFVSLCEKCNIEFIGPSAEMISLLGDKDMARKTMREAGVPVTPGCDIVETLEKARQEAEKLAFRY